MMTKDEIRRQIYWIASQIREDKISIYFKQKEIQKLADELK